MKNQLARKLNLRNTPELRFHIDRSIEYGNHIEKIIEQINEEK